LAAYNLATFAAIITAAAYKQHNRFQGHQDIISGIGYLPPPLDCYITSSWDQHICLWKRPLTTSTAGSDGSAAAGGASKAAAGRSGSKGEAAAGLLPEHSDDGNTFVSEYEKAHPLIVPSALSQVGSAHGCVCAQKQKHVFHKMGGMPH
jgi:hypothetical protein